MCPGHSKAGTYDGQYIKCRSARAGDRATARLETARLAEAIMENGPHHYVTNVQWSCAAMCDETDVIWTLTGLAECIYVWVCDNKEIYSRMLKTR